MSNRKIRIRSKKLEQISADRMALALWLMARDITEQDDAEKTSPKRDEPTSREEAA